MPPDGQKRAMQREELFLNALLEHSADHIYFKDAQGRFIRASRSLARWFGLTESSELVGKQDSDFFTKEHALQAARDEAHVMQTQKAIEGKIEKETWPDGTVTWVSTSKLPLLDEHGCVLGIHGISRDVTNEHKANEDLKRLAEDLRERNETYERDLRLAADVFEVFSEALPAVLPPGADPASAFVRCACHYQPTGAVGGDFHLLQILPDGRVRILLCDVMGHGMQAALVAVLLRTLAQQASSEDTSLSRWMEGLNSRLAERFLNKGTVHIATALGIDMDRGRDCLRMVSAGHPPPLLQDAGSGSVVRVIADDQTGPALGVLPDSSYVEVEARWSQGDKLVLFTDGLPECRDPSGVEFDGEITKRLARTCAASADRVVSDLIAAAAEHRGEAAFEDDLCVIVFERVRSS